MLFFQSQTFTIMSCWEPTWKTILLLYRFGFLSHSLGRWFEIFSERCQSECGYFCNSDFSVLTQRLGIMLMWVLLGSLRTQRMRLSRPDTMKRNESTCATWVLSLIGWEKSFIILIMPSRVELPVVYFIADIEFDIWTDSIIDGIMDGSAAVGDS